MDGSADFHHPASRHPAIPSLHAFDHAWCVDADGSICELTCPGSPSTIFWCQQGFGPLDFPGTDGLGKAIRWCAMRGRSADARGAALLILVAAAACTRASTDSGCSKDSDCKADRVCQAGQCTSVPAPVQAVTPTRSKVRKARLEIDKLAQWRVTLSSTPSATLSATDRQDVLRWIDNQTSELRDVSEATPDADFAIQLLWDVQTEEDLLKHDLAGRSVPTATDGWDCFQNCISCQSRCPQVDGVNQVACDRACAETSGQCAKALGLTPIAGACSCRE
jgi:hypothetical protein